MIVIESELFHDEARNKPLPRLIGPFANLLSAHEYVGSLGGVWGDWKTAPICVPEPRAVSSAHDDGCEADWGSEGQESPCRCAERAQGEPCSDHERESNG